MFYISHYHPMRRSKFFVKDGQEYEFITDSENNIDKVIINNKKKSTISNSKSRVANLDVTLEITPMNEFENKRFAQLLF